MKSYSIITKIRSELTNYNSNKEKNSFIIHVIYGLLSEFISTSSMRNATAVFINNRMMVEDEIIIEVLYTMAKTTISKLEKEKNSIKKTDYDNEIETLRIIFRYIPLPYENEFIFTLIKNVLQKNSYTSSIPITILYGLFKKEYPYVKTVGLKDIFNLYKTEEELITKKYNELTSFDSFFSGIEVLSDNKKFPNTIFYFKHTELLFIYSKGYLKCNHSLRKFISDENSVNQTHDLIIKKFYSKFRILCDVVSFFAYKKENEYTRHFYKNDYELINFLKKEYFEGILKIANEAIAGYDFKKNGTTLFKYKKETATIFIASEFLYNIRTKHDAFLEDHEIINAIVKTINFYYDFEILKDKIY